MVDESRYARQLALAEIGPDGQRRLAAGSVLIAGCGALGTHQAQLLVRAGVGHVRIADGDAPEPSNLPRQVLFDHDDVAAGRPKAEVAAARLARVDPEARIEGRVARIGPDNVEEMITGMDLVLDATDNFPTRYVLNDACVKRGIPWIYGGIVGTSGMCLAVVPGRSACLRCLFPTPPAAPDLPSPASGGILNTAPALVAAVQATEAIKLLCGAPPATDLLLVDPWQRTFRSVPVTRDPGCHCCGQRRFVYLGD